MGRTRTGKALTRSEVERAYVKRRVPLEEAVARIRSGWRIYVSGNAATPIPFLRALAAREDLEGVELVHVLQLGEDPFQGLPPGRFRRRSLFVGPADREAVNQGRADYVPVHLHQVPWLFQRGLLPLDAAVVVSPPDEYGFLSLGVEVIASRPPWRPAPSPWASSTPGCPGPWGTPSSTSPASPSWRRWTTPCPPWSGGATATSRPGSGPMGRGWWRTGPRCSRGHSQRRFGSAQRAQGPRGAHGDGFRRPSRALGARGDHRGAQDPASGKGRGYLRPGLREALLLRGRQPPV